MKLSLFTKKCRVCKCRYGNNLVKGANTPAGTKGRCAPCTRDADTVKGKRR